MANLGGVVAAIVANRRNKPGPPDVEGVMLALLVLGCFVFAVITLFVIADYWTD